MRKYADIVFRRTKVHPLPGRARWGVRTPHIIVTNVAAGTHSQEKPKEKYT